MCRRGPQVKAVQARAWRASAFISQPAPPDCGQVCSRQQRFWALLRGTEAISWGAGGVGLAPVGRAALAAVRSHRKVICFYYLFWRF